MIYLARDNQYTIDPERNIKIDVDKDSFWILQDVSVEMDIDLIEQAVNNLLENAGKYSFNDTIVHLFGGLNQDGTFHITVKNQGIAITAEEVEKVIERRWQSRLARSVIGGGSGIGLWIVHHIMKAHRGDLVITPTTEDYWTSIQLTFPTRKNR